MQGAQSCHAMERSILAESAEAFPAIVAAKMADKSKADRVFIVAGYSLLQQANPALSYVIIPLVLITDQANYCFLSSSFSRFILIFTKAAT